MLERAVRRIPHPTLCTLCTLHSAYHTRCMQNSPHHTRPTPFTVGAPVMHVLYPATHTLYPKLSTPYPTPHNSCPMPHTQYPTGPRPVPRSLRPHPAPKPSSQPCKARLHFSVYIVNKKAGEPESEGLSTLQRIHIFSETV